MELNELLLNLKNGERRALVEIYERTKRAVYSVAYGVLQNNAAAEDVMQETYIKICENIDGYDGGKPLGWICAIAKNQALDIYRKNKRLVGLSDNGIGQNEEDKNGVENDILASNIIEIARKTLTKTEFMIVHLHLIGGLKHREISKLVGKAPSSVRWIYTEAIKKIRAVVDKD